ncbi:MAG: Uma2 family endonuclease [Acidobacteriota bacterium]|nr:Uma2 family endonuclease [Acidobacteriota bacterium]
MVRQAETETTVRFERYADFRQWVEGRPGYWQLVRGIPMPSPAPNIRHQRILGDLYALFRRFVIDRQLGYVFFAPTDVKLWEDTVYQPDLVVVLRAHGERIRETHVEGAPDVVVEVLSASTAKADRGDKRQDYERAGVGEYWVVDPETATVEVYVLEGGVFQLYGRASGTGVVRSRTVPDLVVDVEALFQAL